LKELSAMKKFFLIPLMIIGYCTFCAEVMHLGAETGKSEVSGAGITVTDTAFSGKKAYLCPRRVELRSKTSFKINPDAYYIVSAWVKTVDPVPSHMYLGLIPCTADKKYIAHQYFSDTPAAVAELAEPAAKGNKSITVKNGLKWKATRFNAVAFNAKADGSDLPNRDVSSGIVSIKRNTPEGDVITFSKALKKDYPAGTLVREHSFGGYHYLKKGVIAPGSWVRWESRKIKGSSIRKADMAQVILVINLADEYKERGLFVDDIKVEEFAE
jgi:hypothetical protein